MLLPSALSCPRPAGRPRLQASLFTSPPASPPNQSTTLYQTCLSLQSMLQSPQPQLQPSPFFNESAQLSQERPEQQRRQLPTPPMRNAPLPSPMKLRLRSHSQKSATSPVSSSQIPPTSQFSRKKVSIRPPPRGANKRRRDDENEANENEEIPMESSETKNRGPSTPKRLRIAPETMPLGLERRDFEMLYENHQYTSSSGLGICLPAPRKSDAPGDRDDKRNQGIDWSSEEDRQLVELVLEKLRLSKSEWQDCARSLGRDSGNIKRRWQSLLEGGGVGFRGRASQERNGSSATWR